MNGYDIPSSDPQLLERAACVGEASARQYTRDGMVGIDRRPDGVVYNDMHPGNILCDGRSVFAAIDWDAAGWGFTLRDIGRCVAGTEVWFALEDDVLSGYLQRRPLSPQQRRELAAWRTYTFVDFLEFAARANRPNGVKDMLDLLSCEATSQGGG